jgi:hypothetical protein
LHHHYLLRASEVCCLWRRLVNHSNFLGHFRERHNGIPPLIGVYHNNCFPSTTRFTLTGADCSATSIFQCRESWRILDCRHGRVLFLDDVELPALIVWDPMTARSDRITMPSDLTVYDYDKLSGAVVCTASADANGHHMDCRSSPFLVVLLTGRAPTAVVSVYSSVAGEWSMVVAYHGLPTWADVCPRRPCVVIGNTVYQLLLASYTLCFNLETRSFSVISHPPETKWMDIQIMKLDGTTLGLVVADNASFSLYFWEREDESGDWVLRRTVKLDTLQPMSTVVAAPLATGNNLRSIKLLGACEFGNVIFLGTRSDRFLFYLDSMQLKEISFGRTVSLDTLSPYESFYAPR